MKNRKELESISDAAELHEEFWNGHIAELSFLSELDGAGEVTVTAEWIERDDDPEPSGESIRDEIEKLSREMLRLRNWIETKAVDDPGPARAAEDEPDPEIVAELWDAFADYRAALLGKPDPVRGDLELVWARRVARILSADPDPEPIETGDPEATRCTCEWRHPANGQLRHDYPAELDPHCDVHGEPAGFPGPPRPEGSEWLQPLIGFLEERRSRVTVHGDEYDQLGLFLAKLERLRGDAPAPDGPAQKTNDIPATPYAGGEDWHPTFRTLDAVLVERRSQDEKWGTVEERVEAGQTLEDWIAILVEEVGEYAKAVLEKKEGNGGLEPIWHEATQVAATGYAILEFIAAGGTD